MPFMDGYDATNKIQKLYASMDIEQSRQPAIYGVTGHVEKEYVKRATDSGMTRVFSKPVRIIDFAKLLIEHNYLDRIPKKIYLNKDD